jgi:hypothetical protein
MDYKTLMLHLPIQEPPDARLQVAGALAEQFGCKIIGSAACDLSPPPYYTDAIFDRAQALMEQERAALTTQMAELESLFRKRLQGRAKEIEWRTALTRLIEALPARFRRSQ